MLETDYLGCEKRPTVKRNPLYIFRAASVLNSFRAACGIVSFFDHNIQHGLWLEFKKAIIPGSAQFNGWKFSPYTHSVFLQLAHIEQNKHVFNHP